MDEIDREIVRLLYANGRLNQEHVDVNRVAVARLLGNALDVCAGTIAASMAVLISLATANAYVAATARLGYALARDRAFPS